MKANIVDIQKIFFEIPSFYNGTFNYNFLTSNHYADGWREVVVPTYEPTQEKLSPLYILINDVVTKEVLLLTQEELDALNPSPISTPAYGFSNNDVAGIFRTNGTGNISEYFQEELLKAYIQANGVIVGENFKATSLPNATGTTAYNRQLVSNADGTFGWEARADTENLLVNSVKKINGSGYFPNEDGTVLYHIVRWFTPTGTFSSTGTTVTTTGGQLTASMVGAKIGVGTDKRIITAFLTSNTCTVDSAFSQNYVSQPLANWGVFSKSFENRIDGTVNLINTVGTTRGRTIGDMFSCFEFTSGGGGYGLRDITFDLANTSVLRWANSYPYTGTKDAGLGRNSAGVLEINNGTLGTLRDLRLRNIIPTLSFYANDAAADADTALPSGAFYKITGGRQIFQKP
jgi:hypothetical protein